VLELCRNLAEADPRSAQAQRDLAVALQRLGGVQLAQGDSKGALDSFREDLTISRKLAEADPRSAQAQRDLLISYSKLGNLARESSDFRQAADWYARAVDVPKAFPKPEVFSKEIGIVEGLLRFCRAAEQALDDLAVVDKQPAGERWQLLAAVQRALVQRKDFAKAVQAAEKLAGLADKPGAAYAAACAFALCVPLADKDEARDKLAARAIELLKQAVAKGYNNAAHMKQDTDLDPLRQRDDFKKLLAELDRQRPDAKP
jgi:tetratricopeptide (TPR) repeat protein